MQGTLCQAAARSASPALGMLQCAGAPGTSPAPGMLHRARAPGTGSAPGMLHHARGSWDWLCPRDAPSQGKVSPWLVVPDLPQGR